MEAKKNVFVSGGSGGIGSEVVREIFSRGHNVIFTYYKGKEETDRLYEELKQKAQDNQWIYAFQCDLSDEQHVRKMINENKKLFSTIDVLINNAGRISPAPQFLIMADMNLWWTIFHNNIGCVVNVTRAIVPFMIRRKKGTIVNVTSLSGISGDPGQSAYAASKAAIINLSKTLNKELCSFGITVNCVSPGLIDTKMADEASKTYREGIIKYSMAKRLGRADKVANIIVYLAVEAPDYLVNQNITISGGL